MTNGIDIIKAVRDMLSENSLSIPNEIYEFLDELTPDDVGREIFEGGWIVRFEGFSDVCIADVEDRLKLPDTDNRHLAAFEDVFDEVLRQWVKEEGIESIDWGFVGDENYPIQYAIFFKGN